MRGPALPVACLLLLALPAIASAQAKVSATQGMSLPEFRKWIDRAGKDRVTPLWISAYNDGAEPRFSAASIDNRKDATWQLKTQLDRAAFQRVFNNLTRDGFRLAGLCGYLDKGDLRMAGLFVKGDGEERAWQSKSGLTSAEFQKALDQQVAAGKRPTQITGYPDGKGGCLMAGLFREDKDTACLARHDQTEAQYQKTLVDSAAEGYRPENLSVYPTPGGHRFAVVLVKDKVNWMAKHGLTSERCRSYSEEYAREGYYPSAAAGYATSDGVRFAVLWIQPPPEPKPPAPPEQPTSGMLAPELAPLDDAMQRYLRERSISCGTLAVSRDGKLALARGYGYADRDKKRLVSADDPFRIASVSKPITAAAVRKLVRDGKLALDTRVFPLLALAPSPGFETSKRDPRLDEITIAHLLKHEGGFDREKSFDPMFRTFEICRELNLKGPPGPADVTRYMLGRPLDFAPGSKSAYSNFGFCLLGQAVAKASGQGYFEYTRDAILKPIGAASLEPGRSLPKDRNRREPFYDEPERMRNVFDPDGPAVLYPDGGFYLEAMDAHGGWIGSASDLVKFLDAYHISGEPRLPGESVDAWMFGKLPGTFAMICERPDGVNLAACFNQSKDESAKDYFAIRAMLSEACDKLK